MRSCFFHSLNSYDIVGVIRSSSTCSLFIQKPFKEVISFHRSSNLAAFHSKNILIISTGAREHSWICTVITQISLCVALFIVLNIGQPQKHVHHNPAERSSLGVCFLSVVGGYRPPIEQILLLKQMEKAARACKAEFVINISELGEDDPLMQNATEHFQSLGVSWYMTHKESEPDYYLKKIVIPGGKSLDIITVNTKAFQDSTSGARNRLLWSSKMLEESYSDWRILVGFDSLLPCNGSVDGKDNHESLQHIFFNYGLNAYLSGLACAEYGEKEVDTRHSYANGMLRGPFLITPNNILQPHEDREIAFLLHRVSSLEFV